MNYFINFLYNLFFVIKRMSIRRYPDSIIIGQTGPTGATGCSGSSGLRGATGASAYDIWVKLGNKGTEFDFIASLATSSNGKVAYTHNPTERFDLPINGVISDDTVILTKDNLNAAEELVSTVESPASSKLEVSQATGLTYDELIDAKLKRLGTYNKQRLIVTAKTFGLDSPESLIKEILILGDILIRFIPTMNLVTRLGVMYNVPLFPNLNDRYISNQEIFIFDGFNWVSQDNVSRSFKRLGDLTDDVFYSPSAKENTSQ